MLGCTWRDAREETTPGYARGGEVCGRSRAFISVLYKATGAGIHSVTALTRCAHVCWHHPRGRAGLPSVKRSRGRRTVCTPRREPPVSICNTHRSHADVCWGAARREPVSPVAAARQVDLLDVVDRLEWRLCIVTVDLVRQFQGFLYEIVQHAARVVWRGQSVRERPNAGNAFGPAWVLIRACGDSGGATHTHAAQNPSATLKGLPDIAGARSSARRA
jgi:hypothetical protein